MALTPKETPFETGAIAFEPPDPQPQPPSTFTLKPQYIGGDVHFHASFAYGPDRETYIVLEHMEEETKIPGVTNHHIKAGLRDLKIFNES